MSLFKQVTRIALFASAWALAVAILLSLVMTGWNWLDNPSGIFHGPEGTNWAFMAETAVSWLVPVFLYLFAFLLLLRGSWIARRRMRSRTRIDRDDARQAGLSQRQSRGLLLVCIYPFVLLAFCTVANWLMGVSPWQIEVPGDTLLVLMVTAAVLLLLNHSWIMTVTELTRVNYHLHATPEEWAASGKDSRHASEEGLEELARCHNLHRNTSENTVYFAFLAPVFALVSPSLVAATAWLLLYPLGRLGYTLAYLNANTGLRGICMSLGLLSLYGMASYLGIALLL